MASGALSATERAFGATAGLLGDLPDDDEFLLLEPAGYLGRDFAFDAELDGAALDGAIGFEHLHIGCRAFGGIADGGGRYQQGALGLCQYDEDLRGHLNVKFPLGIWYIEEGVVKDHIVNELRGREDLPDLAVPAPGLAEHGKIYVLADLDADNIGFGDLRPDGHDGQVGNPQDGRRLLIGVERLAFEHADGNHLAGHGRGDFGVAEIGFGGVDGGRSLSHLGRERIYVGGSNIVVGAGDVTVVAGDDRLGKKFLVAVAEHLGKRKLRLLEGALRGHVLQGCVGRGERGVRQNRVDRSEELVDYHLVSAFDLERFQLAGGLSAHIDIVDGLEDAGRHDGAFDIAAFDGSGGIEHFGFAKRPVISEGACTGNEDRANQPPGTPLKEGTKFRRTIRGRRGFGYRAEVGGFHLSTPYIEQDEGRTAREGVSDLDLGPLGKSPPLACSRPCKMLTPLRSEER